MKKYFLYLIFIFSTSFTFAQSSNEGAILFDTTLYNFGKINKGANAECVFSYTNKGKTPLIITDVKASCGCTVPTWTKEPVMPGKSGSVKVKYNTTTIGIFSKTITIYTNDNNRITTLTIKGEVIKKNN